MSKQRYINTKMWEDSWFVELDPIEKLFFIYLLTNPMTTIVGAYELSRGTIGRATGLESRVVDELLKRFGDSGKAHYINGWVVLPNFIKHQNYKSPKIRAGIEAELQNVPEEVQSYIKIPYAYGIDTVSHSNSNSNSNSNGIDPSLKEPTAFKTFFKQPKRKIKPGSNVISQAKQLCQLFTEYKGGDFMNKIHIDAMAGLLLIHGWDRTLEVATFALEIKPKEHQVKISNPIQLADKWAMVVELMEKPVPKETLLDKAIRERTSK